VRWCKAGWKLRGFRHTPAYCRCDTILDTAGAGETALRNVPKRVDEPKRACSLPLTMGSEDIEITLSSQDLSHCCDHMSASAVH
jgi:hypothetical protein